jgi:hypothetical protein
MRVKLSEGRVVHETILHESIHAAFWWFDEKYVTALARDLSTILLRPDVRKMWDN